MQEIEILVKVLEKKEEAFKKLQKLNFKGVKKIFDVYFYDPENKSLRPDALGSLKESFRLRNKDEKTMMAYKLDRFDNFGKWIYSDEHEVEVSDYETTMKIITHLGFKPLVQIDNEKNVFITEKYEVVLEDVKNLGLFLEVEKLAAAHDGDISNSKKEIWNFINTLGIKVSGELNMGKPELMLKQNAPSENPSAGEEKEK